MYIYVYINKKIYTYIYIYIDNIYIHHLSRDILRGKSTRAGRTLPRDRPSSCAKEREVLPPRHLWEIQRGAGNVIYIYVCVCICRL